MTALAMPTPTELAEYIGASTSPESLQELTQPLAAAGQLVDDFVASAWRPVPQSVYTQAVLDTAQAVHKRRASDNSSGGLAAIDGGFTPAEPNDPIQKSVPVLRRYVLPF